MKKSLSIFVQAAINSPVILRKAKSLAKKLKLNCYRSITEINSDFFLMYSENGLQFCQINNIDRVKCLLYVDFVRGKNGYRHYRNLTIRQPLAKAMGIKSGIRPSVFDATAGLGQDAFVLACLGCNVSLCERSPVLHSLLEDGLERAWNEKKTAQIVSTRMHLLLKDSKDFLQNSQEKFHTIYLDPMYPHRTTSALNRQEMRIIRNLVGNDDDSETLLNIAFAEATNRVVVKRPKGAEELSDRAPSFVISAKKSRYDVYLIQIERSPSGKIA